MGARSCVPASTEGCECECRQRVRLRCPQAMPRSAMNEGTSATISEESRRSRRGQRGAPMSHGATLASESALMSEASCRHWTRREASCRHCARRREASCQSCVVAILRSQASSAKCPCRRRLRAHGGTATSATPAEPAAGETTCASPPSQERCRACCPHCLQAGCCCSSEEMATCGSLALPSDPNQLSRASSVAMAHERCAYGAGLISPPRRWHNTLMPMVALHPLVTPPPPPECCHRRSSTPAFGAAY